MKKIVVLVVLALILVIAFTLSATAVDMAQVWTATAAYWTSANMILPIGIIAVETDTGKMKIGDGNTAWTSLKYMHQYSSSANHAVCWKSAGILSYCTNSVGSAGTCTCN